MTYWFILHAVFICQFDWIGIRLCVLAIAVSGLFKYDTEIHYEGPTLTGPIGPVTCSELPGFFHKIIWYMLHVFFCSWITLNQLFQSFIPFESSLLVLPHPGGAIFNFDSRVFLKKILHWEKLILEKLQLFGCGATDLCNKSDKLWKDR